MPRVQLFHSNAAEARERIARLKAAGYRVAHDVPIGPELLRRLREHPPRAVVIDLSRLPSQGRDVALALRTSKATRHVPLVFVDGDPKKVAGIRKLLPDAAFTPWSSIRSALRKAIAYPPRNPVVPRSLLEGYSGTPLPKKLGIQEDTKVGLVAAPPGFRKTLGKLPANAVLRKGMNRCDLVLWFVRSCRELKRGMRPTAARLGPGRLWILWPKKASGVNTDLTQQDVREAGLGAGLVDYKVCAVDATWSGLLFIRRKPTKA